jgi:hypothetical protein
MKGESLTDIVSFVFFYNYNKKLHKLKNIVLLVVNSIRSELMNYI